MPDINNKEEMEQKSRMKELYEDLMILKKGLRFMWVRRATYFMYSGVAFVLALIISFSIPKTYLTSVMLAPENSQGGMNANLAGIASMVGVNVGMMYGDAYTVDLYPTIVSSTDFLMSLKDIRVSSAKENLETTYGEYLVKYQKRAWWSYPIMFVKGWVNRLMEEPEVVYAGVAKKTMPHLTKQEIGLFGMMQKSIVCSVDKLSGVITISAYAKDAEISAIVADSVVKHLNKFIMDYRTNKARTDYEYMSKVCDECKEKYLQAQNAYAEFVESHANLYSPSHKIQADFLENESQLAYSMYSQMLTQVQMVQAKILESTPVYTVIESAYIPEYAESPKKLLIILIFIFLACVTATLKLGFSKLKQNKWRRKV